MSETFKDATAKALKRYEFFILLMAVFAVFLFLKGPATTIAQWIFLVSLLVAGIVGAIIVDVIKFSRKPR